MKELIATLAPMLWVVIIAGILLTVAVIAIFIVGFIKVKKNNLSKKAFKQMCREQDKFMEDIWEDE